MKYTLPQYQRICADVESQIAAMRECHMDEPEPFNCERTLCSFCPFTGKDGVCPDSLPIPPSQWSTARTVDGWQKWLDWFASNNDPTRSVPVEISQQQRDALYSIYQNIDPHAPKEERDALRAVIESFDEQTRN